MEQELAIKRFKAIREEHHFTQAEFAEKLGLKSTTADIERGRTKLSGQVITELLRQFNINPLWIYGYSPQKHLDLNQTNVMPKVVSIDTQGNDNMLLVNQRASAGYPQNIHDTGWHQGLPAFNLPLPQFKNATYRGFQVEGNSMTPNLHPGEWVLGKSVESVSHITEGKIYVVVTHESVVVKKLYRLPDISKLRLVSINPEYIPFDIAIADIQELWQVNSKLTFSLDANSENHLLKELKESMEALKLQLQAFKKEQPLQH